MFCKGCGNDVPEGAECAVCADGRAVRRRPGAEQEWAPESTPPAPQPPQGRVRTTRLCRGCGNEVEGGEECRVCAAGRAHKRHTPNVTRKRSTICTVCGNEIVPGESCAVCAAGRGHQKKSAPELSEGLCPACGNVVWNVNECPVCLGGRAPAKARERARSAGPCCPRCNVALTTETWEEVEVLMCSTCQGALFPVGGLESTLDKLREGVESTNLADVLREFRGRTGGVLPAAVRYRSCPRCRAPMARRNYAGVSGVIVDFCGTHGTWVDQAPFSQLADFITRGGDVLAARNPLNRKR